MAVKDSRLVGGRNPLAYLGTNAYSPPNTRSYDRAPTTDDCRGFYIGDMWIDQSASPENIYILVAKDAGLATWLVSNTSIALPISISDGGTGRATLTDGALLVGDGTNPVEMVGPGTDGQILISATAASPVWADLTSTGGTVTITGGAGTLNIESGAAVPIQFDGDAGSAVPALGVITIAGGIGVATSGAGSTVTISTTGGGINWSEVTGTTQAMAVNYGYLANNVAQVTLTLPATAALFSIFEVVGKGAGGWKIAQNAGQTIIWDETLSSTTGAGGYIESTDDYDKVRLMCSVADTTFTAVGSKGNITIV